MKKKEPVEEPKDLAKGAIWTANYSCQDKSTWSKEEWVVYHIDYLESVTRTLSQHRAFLAFTLVVLAFISIVK